MNGEPAATPTPIDHARRRGRARRAVGATLVAAAALGLLSACSTVPIPPTYTQAELQDRCESRGGWWHPDPTWGRGFCEYQSAMLMQSP